MLPSLPPSLASSVRRGFSFLGSTLFKHLHWWSSFRTADGWGSAMCWISLPHSPLAIPSLKNFTSVGFHSAVNLLLSMEVSQISEETLPWLEKTISSQPLVLLCRHSRRWVQSTCHQNQWGRRLLLSSGECWARGWKSAAFSPHHLVIQVEFLFLKHRRAENSLVHPVWSRIFLFVFTWS